MFARKFLLRACASGALTVGGLFGHSFAADAPRDTMPVKFDAASFHKQFCADHYARHVGRMAYLEAKLSLNETQRPLFESWKESVLSSARAHESTCLAHQPDFMHRHAHGFLERQAHMKERLQTRLADITAQEPSLKALYDSLTPDQKQVFDQAGMEGHMGRGRMGPPAWHDHGPHGPDGGPDGQDG